MKPETIIAIASTVIAGAALVVAVWSGNQTRTHNELSVEPVVNIEFTNHPDEEYSGLVITNVGLGPAIIISLSVSLDNREMPDLGYGGIKTALSQLKIDNDWVTISKLNAGAVIKEGETVPLIAVSQKYYNDYINRILAIKNKINLTVTYQSMYQIEKSASYETE